MRIKRIIPAIVAVAALAVPAAANASVTFEPGSGTGFVGKGDVQTLFGWNDAKLQTNAPAVSFTYKKHSSELYNVTCVWYTEHTEVWFEGTGQDKIKHTEVVQVRHDQDKSADVTSSVAYDPKSASRTNPNGKVTGFNLTGTANRLEQQSGTVPVEGAPCPATGNADGTDNAVDKTIESVELVSSESSEALFAVFGGDLRQLVWPEPAPIVA